MISRTPGWEGVPFVGEGRGQAEAVPGKDAQGGDRDRSDRVEGVVRAEGGRIGEDPLNQCVRRDDGVGHADVIGDVVDIADAGQVSEGLPGPEQHQTTLLRHLSHHVGGGRACR